MNLAMTKLEKLVAAFAQNVAAQTDEIFHGSAAKGNRHAKRYIAAFDKLCAHGDAGRDALAVEMAARGKGLAALCAQQTLKNWEDGTWALDPG